MLLKRSDKVLAYKNLWSVPAGFLDDEKTIENKVIEELTEELGLQRNDVKEIRQGEVYTFEDKELGRDWVRHLVLAEVSNPNVKIDWEHTEHKWIFPNEIKQYSTTPGLADDLEKIMLLQ